MEHDAAVVRAFSRHEFGDEANVARAQKESWFRFMDWTWIAFMICTVDQAVNRSAGLTCECPSMRTALGVSTPRGIRILRCWWCVSEFSRLMERRGDPRSNNSGV